MLVERILKLFLTMKVKNKIKKLVSMAINKLLKLFTFDNGGKFGGHASITKALKCKICFAKPYHSWQRMLSENTNGLL